MRIRQDRLRVAEEVVSPRDVARNRLVTRLKIDFGREAKVPEEGYRGVDVAGQLWIRLTGEAARGAVTGDGRPTVLALAHGTDDIPRTIALTTRRMK